MNKVLLTGASGFVGSRMLKILKDDHEVVIVGRNKIDGHQFFYCDFLEDRVNTDWFEGVDTIFHLAGLAHTDLHGDLAESLHMKINYSFTKDFAKSASENQIRQFIFLSSVKAQSGIGHSEKITEESNACPEGYYGISKKLAEDTLIKISEQSQMSIKIIRSSLVYGPNVKGNLKSMKEAVKRNIFPPIPEFQNRRSMIHVDDLIRSLIFISKKNNLEEKIFIVTDGKDYSSCEIYETLALRYGKFLPKWRVPKKILSLLAKMNFSFSRKIKKLMEDECYSSSRIEQLGFKTKYLFTDNYEEII